MVRALPALIVCAAAVSSGAVAGLWTHRWVPAANLEAAAERLQAVPETVGEWDGRPQAVDPREVAGAQAAGMLRRDYVNRHTGTTVAVSLLCGPAGPISVHTPDVCYRGSGFEEVGTATRVSVPGVTGAQFWVRNFQKQGAVPIRLRVFYAWSVAGSWESPDNPRLHFAHLPVLHKLYVNRELARLDEPLDGDPALEFLKALVPQLNPTLFPAAGP